MLDADSPSLTPADHPVFVKARCKAEAICCSEMTANLAVAIAAAALSLSCIVAAAAASTNGDVNAHKYHIGQRCGLEGCSIVTPSSAIHGFPFPVQNIRTLSQADLTLLGTQS